MIVSSDCVESDFNTRWYQKWAQQIGLPVAKHPKFWEMAVIAELLDSYKCLKPGVKGLGMGVGNEQLVSIFASRGAEILATDQDPEDVDAQKWNNGQLAHGKSTLFYPHIVNKTSFDKLVRYEPYDMNTLNKRYLNKFDFVWHNCVIGHLGSLDNAITQLIRSARYLKPGGRLVFTTELNVSSFTDTITEGSDTVFWRLSDLEELFCQMLDRGLVADRFKLRLGQSEHDTRVNYNSRINPREIDAGVLDNPDLSEIKIPFGGFVITQIVLSFQKKKVRFPHRIISKYKQDTIKNAKILTDHLAKNSDLNEYFASYDTIQYADAQLMPEQKEITVDMEPGDINRVNLRFLNRSEMKLFDYSVYTPYNRPPLVLGTFDPVNRKSKFATSDWSSPSRPTLSFTPSYESEHPSWNSHRVNQAEWFEYVFSLKAPRKPGVYVEEFVLIFEGSATVLSSRVVITINVLPKKAKKTTKSKRKIFSIKEFFKSIGWQGTSSSKAIMESFSDWLELVAKKEFRTRLYIKTYEFLALLESHIKTIYPNFVIPKTVLSNIKKHQSHYIQINHRSLVPGLRSELILIASTPRVGGTAFSRMLSDITKLPHYAITNLDTLDFNSLSGQTIIHNHITYDEYVKESIPLPVQVITIARNPLDTLVSAFMFAQNNPSVVYWLNERVFKTPVDFKGKTVKDEEFYKWATSDQSSLMLSVTPSWLDYANSYVRYDDFISNPVEAFRDVLNIILPNRMFDDADIARVAKTTNDSFLKNATNKHRWNGGINYAVKLIPKNILKPIIKKHRQVIDQLGYSSLLS